MAADVRMGPNVACSAAHCEACVASVCTAAAGCAVAPCASCGVPMHSCKLQDHAQLCNGGLARCSGCACVLPRGAHGAHLADCPASTAVCFICSRVVRRRDLSPHVEHDHHELCMAFRHCPFHGQGCGSCTPLTVPCGGYDSRGVAAPAWAVLRAVAADSRPPNREHILRWQRSSPAHLMDLARQPASRSQPARPRVYSWSSAGGTHVRELEGAVNCGAALDGRRGFAIHELPLPAHPLHASVNPPPLPVHADTVPAPMPAPGSRGTDWLSSLPEPLLLLSLRLCRADSPTILALAATSRALRAAVTRAACLEVFGMLTARWVRLPGVAPRWSCDARELQLPGPTAAPHTAWRWPAGRCMAAAHAAECEFRPVGPPRPVARPPPPYLDELARRASCPTYSWAVAVT